MKEKVMGIIQEVLEIDSEELEARFDSNDIWDSLNRVEILFAVEEEFDITFEEEELAEMSTPQKLCDAILRKVD